MNKEELYYLANICYYDFDSEEDCTNCNRYDKCREKIAEYNEKKQNNIEKNAN